MPIKDELCWVWIILGLSTTGCTQALPPAPIEQSHDLRVLSAPSIPKSKSNRFSALELQRSFADEADLLQRIQLEISNDRCTRDSDCTTIPIGEKACGGPERWLACTQESAKKRTLRPLLEQLISLQKTRNARSDMLSNCQVSEDPGAVCRANRCVLRPTGEAV